MDESATPPISARRSWGLVAAVGALCLVVGVIATILVTGSLPEASSSDGRSVQRFTLSTEDRLDLFQAIAPDGATVVYTTPEGLWLRQLDQLAARLVPETDGAVIPFWAPGSDWLGFARGGVLWKMRLSGGEAVKICDLPPGGMASASWGESGEILFVVTYGGRTSSVLRVSAQGGDAQTFRQPDRAAAEVSFTGVTHLPSGRGILIVVQKEGEVYEIQLLDEEGTTPIVSRGVYFETLAYSPTGHLLYSDSGYAAEIWAVRLSLDDRKTVGDPFLVRGGGAGMPTVSNAGTLVYRQVDGDERQLAWVSRQGEVLEPLGEPLATLSSPRISRDGRTVTFTGGAAAGGDLYILRTDRRSQIRLTQGQFLFHATLSPSGDRIHFTDSRAGGDIKSVALDGGDSQLVFGDDTSDWSPDWSADGRYLVFYRIDPATGRDLWFLDSMGDGDPVPYLQAPHDQIHPRISPDGSLIAYQSNDQDRWQVYVETFPERTRRWPVSEGDGRQPHWSPRGGELFFIAGADLMAVTFTQEPDLRFSEPQRLFGSDDIGSSLAPRLGGYEWYWDVDVNAQRFLVVQGLDRGRSEVVLVHNWAREFEGLVGAD